MWKPRKAKRSLCSPRVSVENLEGRALLTGVSAVPDLAILSATQQDAHTVVVHYQVSNAPIAEPITVQVYRSTEAQLNTSGELIATTTINPTGSVTRDLTGGSAYTQGSHAIALTTVDGLGLNPSHPFVVVSANSDHSSPETNYVNDTASYRIYSVGVISHGGVQPANWGDKGPPWENRMAKSLKADGYDVVIPFNWVKSSSSPGAAKGVAPFLLTKVTAAAASLPQDAPVDLHFIGHSEGAVVNSQVLKSLAASSPTNIANGYIKETMLDPHAASNHFDGPQMSVSSGFLGSIAKSQITKYQARANDPLVAVPSNVDSAEVFYQHTAANHTHTSNGGIYNLWGQVPIQGNANYYDITHDGVSHAGTYGVFDWYQDHVVPSLKDGAPQVAARTVSIDRTSIVQAGPNVSISGMAPAGSEVTVRAITKTLFFFFGSGSSTASTVGIAIAGSDGKWSLTSSKSLGSATAFSASVKGPVGLSLPMVAKAVVSNPLMTSYSSAYTPAPILVSAPVMRK